MERIDFPDTQGFVSGGCTLVRIWFLCVGLRIGVGWFQVVGAAPSRNIRYPLT